MNSIAEAALAHVRKMEARIERQTALIVKLKAYGCDVAQPARTLIVLRNALEEMRFHLGRLMPASDLEQWHGASQPSRRRAN